MLGQDGQEGQDGNFGCSLLLGWLCALGNDARPRPLDAARQELFQLRISLSNKCIFLGVTGNHNLSILSFGVKFNYLDAVDDMLFLGARPIEVVGAHNVDGRGRGTPLNYVHYMVRV